MTIYPWQQAVWQRLVQSRERHILPHAFIFSGVQGVGLFEFSQALSAWLLCQQATAQGACGQCKSCQLWHAQNHPDYRLLAQSVDEKTGKTSHVIKVDQVRQLIDFLSKSAQLNGYRVAVIHHADTLNSNAANSLLKNLEETGENVVIILLSEQPLLLLPTIRSRCQQITLNIPPTTQAITWLQAQCQSLNKNPSEVPLLLALSDGAPLAALALSDAPWFVARQALAQDMLEVIQQKKGALQSSQYWQKQLSAEALLSTLQLLLRDIIWHKQGQHEAIKNIDLAAIFTKIATISAMRAMLLQQQQCLSALSLIGANIQTGLLVDNIWQSFARFSSQQ